MKQEEKEQQLREAAYEKYRTNDCNNPQALRLSEYRQEAFIEGVKSEAAKAYWQPADSVNLDELRNKITRSISTFRTPLVDSVVDSVIEVIKPLLQPQEQKQSDWISVDDKLPEKYPVIFLDSRGNPHKHDAWQNTDSGFLKIHYTFWSPIPNK